MLYNVIKTINVKNILENKKLPDTEDLKNVIRVLGVDFEIANGEIIDNMHDLWLGNLYLSWKRWLESEGFIGKHKITFGGSYPQSYLSRKSSINIRDEYFKENVDHWSWILRDNYFYVMFDTEGILYAVDKDGNRISSGNLLRITEQGITLFYKINPCLDLPLDESGKLLISSNNYRMKTNDIPDPFPDKIDNIPEKTSKQKTKN